MTSSGLHSDNGWELDFQFPLPERTEKPRRSGITMIFDKGLGPQETQDLLELCTPHIDFWKLGFASSALYPPALLRRKIALVKSFNISIYPGGTFSEIATVQGKLYTYLQRARELGFSAVEISDGTIQINPRERSEAIKAAREMGLSVLTEIGKKDGAAPFQPAAMAAQVERDLRDGASLVIVEARESGKGVTIFDRAGRLDHEKALKLLREIGAGAERLIWEAPLSSQQVEFIRLLGVEVNLGNVAPKDVLALESLRRGLRADTFRLSLEHKKKDAAHSIAPLTVI
ncbi:MAG: phosphosulfolactate synthase [Bacillota bacterium]